MGQCSHRLCLNRAFDIVKLQRPKKIGDEPDPFPSCKLGTNADEWILTFSLSLSSYTF